MYNVLVVDDNKTNLQLVKQLLSEKYTVIPVLSGKMAVHYVEKRKPDIILLDLLMPEMDGIQTMEQIRGLSNGKDVPVIFLTADQDKKTETRCLKAGAADFIAKPFIPEVMITRIEKALELEDLRKAIHAKMEENTRQLEEAALQSFISIANTIDSKDIYRSSHLLRVAGYAIRFGRHLGFSREERKELEYCALAYDVGNIAIPDMLLMKQGTLTEKEKELIKRHTVSGAELLENITCIRPIRDAAMYHHERFDGAGYPCGLQGESIPKVARILSILDAFVAMTSERAYRERHTKEEACREIRKESGSQFDPELAEKFLEMLKQEEGRKWEVEQLTPQNWSEESSLLMQESNNLLKRILKEQSFVINNMASLDPLTDLHNRKYLEMKVYGYLTDETNEGCFCMIDVDNFKYINDTYGHQAGDVALQKLSKILTDNVRKTDVVCRMGGDEFAIFFEGLTDKAVIQKKAEKILKEYLEMTLNEPEFASTSISIGIAITDKETRDYDALYKKADECLYHVKQNGKNSLYFYGGNEEKVEEGTKTLFAANDIMQLLDEKEYKKGVYKVTYNDFQRIYHFLSRCVERTKQNIQLLLLTVQHKDGEAGDLMGIERGIFVLEQGIATSLRRTDVSTRYSSCQYIVILINADHTGAFKVMERILAYYDKHRLDPEYEVTYDIAQVHCSPGM